MHFQPLTPHMSTAAAAAPANAHDAPKSALMEAAEADARRGRWAAAAQAFAEVARADPGHARAWLGLGVAALELKRYPLALQALGRARALAPRDPYVATNLAGLLRVLGRLPEALELAEEAGLSLPDDPLVQLNRWLLEQDMGHLARAAEGYASIAQRWPRLAAAHYHLGHARLVQGRPTEAEASLRECLRLDSRQDVAHHALVGLLLERGDAAQALTLIDAHRRQHAYDGYDIALRCIALRNLGRAEEAAVVDDTRRWLRVHQLAQAPAGWADVASFNAAILDHVQTHPELGSHRGQATHNGRRIENLLDNASGPIPLLAWWILDRLREYLGGMRTRPHPLGRLIDGALELRGWAVLMHEGGYETPHIHPGGLLSAVYYPAVPEVVRRGDGDAGRLCFGEPDPLFVLDTPPASFGITPQPGMLVIFPSWQWHHTVPFSSAQPRLSLAFDLFPRAPAAG